MNEINVNDESGDKKYFTQIPNIILNHSTSTDQALYLQMKRLAGEGGKCFATQETLMKKLDVGRFAYNKSLNYLLKRGWIKFEGLSGGKTRPIKTYSIVDIWKQNVLEYEKIPSRLAVSHDIGRDTVKISSKILSKLAVEEEPPKEEHILGEAKASQEEKIVEVPLSEPKIKRDTSYYAIFELWGKYPLNWKTNRTEIDAAKNLFQERKLEHCRQALAFYSEYKDMPMCPQILKPSDLDRKWENLKAFKNKL